MCARLLRSNEFESHFFDSLLCLILEPFGKKWEIFYLSKIYEKFFGSISKLEFSAAYQLFSTLFQNDSENLNSCSIFESELKFRLKTNFVLLARTSAIFCTLFPKILRELISKLHVHKFSSVFRRKAKFVNCTDIAECCSFFCNI